MGIFDGIQNAIQDWTGSASDAANNITDNLPTDQITNLGDSVNNASEEVTNKVDDIKNSLGL